LRAGVDLGGTKIQAVVVGDRGARVVGAARRDTPTRGGPEAVAIEIAQAVRDAASAAGIDPGGLTGIGIGAPGSIDAASGSVLQVANVEGFERPFALGPSVAAALGVPARLGNDVSVAVEAERRYGAGRGLRSFLGVFWGTGVGGGLVMDGRLLVGRGSAGEIGHVCAKPGGRRCACGLRGCVEAYAGRGALEERARKESRRRKTVLFDLQRKRGRDRLTSGVWLRALDAGDEVARDLLAEAVEALGVGIGSAVTLLDVEAVVLGGGLGERLGPRWLGRIERAARTHTFFRNPPEYRLAELGDLGGAIGASMLVR
jgi:glucokinase